MEKYKLIIEREFTGTVKDIYSIYADSLENAKEQIKELVNSPADMAMLPHENIIDNDEIHYSENAVYTIKYTDMEEECIEPFYPEL